MSWPTLKRIRLSIYLLMVLITLGFWGIGYYLLTYYETQSSEIVKNMSYVYIILMAIGYISLKILKRIKNF